MKLIKLAEEYIVVSDETPDKYYDGFYFVYNKIFHTSKVLLQTGCKKVIASTFHPELPQIEFDLSDEDANKIGWVNLEKLMSKWVMIPKEHLWVKSFIKELLSNKMFSLEDMANYLTYVEDNFHYHSDTWHDRDTDEPIKRETMLFNFKKILSQPKQYNIEVEMEKEVSYTSDGLDYKGELVPNITDGKLKINKIIR